MLITVSFTKPITFTSNAGVEIKNQTTTEVATINSPTSGTGVTQIGYDVTWVTDPLPNEQVTWSYDDTAVGSDYVDGAGDELPATTLDVQSCPSPVAYDLFGTFGGTLTFDELCNHPHRRSDSGHEWISPVVADSLLVHSVYDFAFSTAATSSEQFGVMDLSALANRPTKVELDIEHYQDSKAAHTSGAILRLTDLGAGTFDGLAACFTYSWVSDTAQIDIYKAAASAVFGLVSSSSAVNPTALYAENGFKGKTLVITDDPVTGIINVDASSIIPGLTHSYDPAGFQASEKNCGIYMKGEAFGIMVHGVRIYDD